MIDDIDDNGKIIVNDDGQRKTIPYTYKECLETFGLKLEPKDQENITKYCLKAFRGDKIFARSTLLQAFHE